MMNIGGKLLCLIATSFLLATDVAAIPLEQFYPFGVGVEDTLVGRVLDGSSPNITLPRKFPFFGNSFSNIYVSMKIIV